MNVSEQLAYLASQAGWLKQDHEYGVVEVSLFALSGAHVSVAQNKPPQSNHPSAAEE